MRYEADNACLFITKKYCKRASTQFLISYLDILCPETNVNESSPLCLIETSEPNGAPHDPKVAIRSVGVGLQIMPYAKRQIQSISMLSSGCHRLRSCQWNKTG